MYHYANQALQRIDKRGAPPWRQCHFFGRYVNFLRGVVAQKQKWWRTDHLTIHQLREDATQDPGQELNLKVGEHLDQILEGDEDALQVIFADDLADGKHYMSHRAPDRATHSCSRQQLSTIPN